jgi:hypothetical protein
MHTHNATAISPLRIEIERNQSVHFLPHNVGNVSICHKVGYHVAERSFSPHKFTSHTPQVTHSDHQLQMLITLHTVSSTNTSCTLRFSLTHTHTSHTLSTQALLHTHKTLAISPLRIKIQRNQAVHLLPHNVNITSVPVDTSYHVAEQRFSPHKFTSHIPQVTHSDHQLLVLITLHTVPSTDTSCTLRFSLTPTHTSLTLSTQTLLHTHKTSAISPLRIKIQRNQSVHLLPHNVNITSTPLNTLYHVAEQRFSPHKFLSHIPQVSLSVHQQLVTNTLYTFSGRKTACMIMWLPIHAYTYTHIFTQPQHCLLVNVQCYIAEHKFMLHKYTSHSLQVTHHNKQLSVLITVYTLCSSELSYIIILSNIISINE